MNPILIKIGGIILIAKVIAQFIGAIPGAGSLPFISDIVRANILWAIGAGLIASQYRIMMIPVAFIVFLIVTVSLLMGGFPLW